MITSWPRSIYPARHAASRRIKSSIAKVEWNWNDAPAGEEVERRFVGVVAKMSCLAKAATQDMPSIPTRSAYDCRGAGLLAMK